jgi:hypothetical protein
MYETSGSHVSVAEHSNALGCDALWLVSSTVIFRVKHSGMLPMKMTALQTFELVVNIHPTT